MANNFMVNINPTFDMGFFSKRLADTYAAKGYNVNVANMGNSCVISFEKGVGGINTFLGMGEGIKATFTRMDNTLSCAFSDEEWTGKIVACLIGWFLCWVPIVTGIIGIIAQTNLPKSISNDVRMIAASM